MKFFENLKNKVKNFDIKKCRAGFNAKMENLGSTGKTLAVTVVLAMVLMFIVCLGVFFAVVKTPEQVMVPNVTGKKLEAALLEMQVKELYPKIQLRYSSAPGDEGTIMAQDPSAGAIVKAGQRVILTVSRGVVLDKVGDYIGQNIDELRMNLQSIFAGYTRPLLVLADPVYKPDVSDAGTILEQNPAPETEISEPIKLQLVVSRGPNFEKTRVPNLIGKSVNEIFLQMQQSKLVFECTSHIAEGDEKAGVVTSQETFESEFVNNYTRMRIDFAFPKKADPETSYGIFEATLTEYPYPVDMTFEAVPEEGNRYTLASFKHTGGHLAIPYAVAPRTQLVLSVVGKEIKKQVVEK